MALSCPNWHNQLAQSYWDEHMKHMTFFALATGLMTSLLVSGCQSPGMITRGQSPEPYPQIQQVAHQNPHEKKQAFVDAVRDHYHEQHNTSTTYSSEVHHVQANCEQYGGSCPSGHCPQGGYSWGGSGFHGGYCPSGGCRSGLCGHGCGNHLNHYPTHRFSQAYKVPNDLVYPAQNAVGGAVVYPYYTHKGPSDFFRAE